MFKSVVQSIYNIHSPVTTVVVMWFLVTGFILSCSGSMESEPQNQNVAPKHLEDSSFIDVALPVKVGMTWDECLPLLKNAKRVALVRQNADRVVDKYKIGEENYNLTFERPSEPEMGPYRLIMIERAETNSDKTDSIIDITQDLKRGLTLNEALPIMQQVGGFFAFETKDRFAAVLQTGDASYRVIFDRPNNVARPDIIANATPEVLRMSNRIPLNALPEFGEYRITAVKKTESQ